MRMWCLRTWFSSGLGSTRLMVGLGYPKGLFQPKRCYDSMTYTWLHTSRSHSLGQDEACLLLPLWDISLQKQEIVAFTGLFFLQITLTASSLMGNTFSNLLIVFILVYLPGHRLPKSQ